MSQYANDEFDRVPEFTDRKGIHRNEAEGAARGSGLGLLMGVGVLALVVGIFSFFVLPQFAGTPADTASAGSSDAVAASPAGAGDATSSEPTGQSAGAASASTGAAADPSAESTGAESSAAESTAAESSDAGEPTGAADAAGESGAASAEVDYAVPVAVYNGSGRAGVAAGGAAALAGGGFTAVSTGNWAKQVDYPVVYFKTDASRATAEEAARVLGVPTVFQTPNIPVEVSVVLGRNYG